MIVTRQFRRHLPTGWKRRALTVVFLLIIFLGFEIGVRLLPPDTIYYTIVTRHPNGPDTTVSGTVTNPATVARWRATMTAQPSGQPVLGIYMSSLIGANNCSRGQYMIPTYSFLWRGIPVEVATYSPSCVPRIQVSRGFIPDWNTYFVEPLPQPGP